ncbi:MAG TPA: HlyD family secretion protein [Methylomirabilota bacterium]
MDTTSTTSPITTDGASQQARPVGPPPFLQRRGVRLAALVGVVLLLAAAGVYWWRSSGRVSTDDAFIEGRIVRVSAQVAGQVAKLAVTDNQRVRAGDLLVQLDDREYRAQAEQAAAETRSAEVAAENAAVDARRAEQLFARQLIARQALDTTLAAARMRAADAEAVRKRAAEAALKLSYTRITSPEDGRVTRRSIEEGAYLQVGQMLMTIVPNAFWVVANFKETQLTRVRPGQPVDIKIDAYPGMVLRGHVDSIQAGTGARFSLLPPENATGNYVKVVQRVPVKIVFDELPRDPDRLGPGMSVVPTVRVR